MKNLKGLRALSLLAAALAGTMVVGCGGSDDPAVAAAPAPIAVVVPENNGLPAASPAEFSLPPAGTTQYAIQLNNATANAGKGTLFTTVLRRQWCYTAENAGAPPELADRNVVPITKIFDDVWFTGLRTVGQYVFKTKQGLFLIDTLNNQNDVQTITEPQLTSVGLTPTSIIAAMPTHGHGDHHGGGAYLQTTYRIPIYLGSGDKAGKPFIPTPLNSDNLLPQELSISDLDLTLLSTPGHTPGTFSGVIPVKHQGKPYKIAFWGGTGMPGASAAALQYLDGTERLWKLARDEQIDGTIHTHPFVDASLNHVDEIRASGLGANNPFLLGKEDSLRSLAVLRSCAAAKVAQIDATAVPVQWQITTVKAAATYIKGQAARNLSASARVSSPYGVVAGLDVTFKFAPSGDTCKARTDATGVATCSVSSTVDQTTFSATFDGTMDSTTIAYLPSKASGTTTALK